MENFKRFLLVFFSAGLVIAQQSNRPIGINLSQITYWSSQYMFVDIKKQSSEWIIQDQSWSTWSADSLNMQWRPDGYPTQIPYTEGGDSFTVFSIMFMEQPVVYPGGTYTLIFEGTGEVEVGWDAATTRVTTPNTLHPFTVTPTEQGFAVYIMVSDVNDPVHNIRIILPGFEDTYETEPFHPYFLEYLHPFSVIRYLNPQAINFSDVENWVDRPTLDYHTMASLNGGGIALEYIVQLSNKTGTDPWIHIPYRAADNYIEGFAQLLYDSLDSGLKVYIEYDDETWNTTDIFAEAYTYTCDMGTSLNLSDDYKTAGLKYTTLRSLQIFEIFESVFGNDSDRLQKVLSSQAGWSWPAEMMLEAYADPTINVNSTTADLFAVAPYFAGSIGDDIGSAGTSGTITVEEILDSVAAQMPGDIATVFTDIKPLVESHGLALVAYEGGPHMVGWSYPDDLTLAQKLIDANRDPRMGEIFCDYLDLWYNTTSSLYLHFEYITAYDNVGSWGLLEYMGQDTSTSVKWMALYDCVFDSTLVSATRAQLLPNEFKLYGNYPNPFNPTTILSYVLPQRAEVSLVLYDILGRQVRTLVNREMQPGYHQVQWNALELPSGIYIARLITPEYTRSIKMLLLK